MKLFLSKIHTLIRMPVFKNKSSSFLVLANFVLSLFNIFIMFGFKCTAKCLDNHILYIVFPLIFLVPQLVPYIVITILLTIFPMLFLLSRDYFVAANTCFLVPSLLCSSPFPFPSGNFQLSLHIHESLSIFFFHFLFFRIHI